MDIINKMLINKTMEYLTKNHSDTIQNIKSIRIEYPFSIIDLKNNERFCLIVKDILIKGGE